MRLFKFLKRGVLSTQPVVSSTNTDSEIPNYNGVADKKHWAKIQFAFRSGETNYFCWTHDVNIAIERMVAATEIYREAEWRLTPALIQQAFSKINKLVFDDKIKNEGTRKEEISKITVMVQERLSLAFQPSMDLKFASVVYFDERENPFDYDYQYAAKKIENWLKNKDVPAFFLKMPESRLIPGGAELTRLSQNYLQHLNAETTLNVLLMEMLDITAKDSSGNTKDLQKTLALQKELELTLKRLSSDLAGNSTS